VGTATWALKFLKEKVGLCFQVGGDSNLGDELLKKKSRFMFSGW
jgi:hypothetical protein